jgi:5-methylthioribose kinase
VVWKDALLKGEVDVEIARMAGVLLGWIHRGSANDPALAQRFAELMPLVQGRIDPYHRATLAAHPDLAALIEEDIERLMTQRRALVLGDYSPKNLIAYPGRLLLLDFEVAHWGDPAFDAAFLITHLVLKAVHCGSDEYLAAARTFWEAYLAAGGSAHEQDVALELCVLLLCRVDGKSKAEYLDEEERSFVRGLARELLLNAERTLALLDRIALRGVAR